MPPDLETICLKSLEKEAARCYATAEGLADDLRPFCEGRPAYAPVVAGTAAAVEAASNPLPATLAAVPLRGRDRRLGDRAGPVVRNAGKRHLREEQIARRESEAHYLTCRRLLGELRPTHDLRLHNPDGRPRPDLFCRAR